MSSEFVAKRVCRLRYVSLKGALKSAIIKIIIRLLVCVMAILQKKSLLILIEDMMPEIIKRRKSPQKVLRLKILQRSHRVSGLRKSSRKASIHADHSKYLNR